MSIRIPVLLVVASVFLAGCGGGSFLVDTDSGPSLESNPDGTATPESIRYPAGINESGVNTTAIARNHGRVLAGQSLTFSYFGTESTGEYHSAFRLAQQVNATRERYHRRTSYAGTNESRYLHDGLVYYRYEHSDRDPAYVFRERRLDEEQLTGADDIGKKLDDANYSFVGSVTRNGIDLVRLRATTADYRGNSYNNVSAYNATALVDESGIVRSIHINLTATANGVSVTRTTDIRTTDVGTTVVPVPGWFDEARSNTPTPLREPDLPPGTDYDTSTEHNSTTLVSYELDALVNVTGSQELLESASLHEWGISKSWGDVPEHTASSYVELSTAAPMEQTKVLIRYNESMVSGDERGLAIYYTNMTGGYQRLESYVDTEKNTVMAVAPAVMEPHGYGEARWRVTFVVYHVDSWEALWDTERTTPSYSWSLENASIGNDDSAPTPVDGVEQARVSDFVDYDPGTGDGTSTLLVGYDESSVPDGDEAGLAMYRYDESERTYVVVDSTVDPDANAVSTTSTEPGTYVVLHQDTWEAETSE